MAIQLELSPEQLASIIQQVTQQLNFQNKLLGQHAVKPSSRQAVRNYVIEHIDALKKGETFSSVALAIDCGVVTTRISQQLKRLSAKVKMVKKGTWVKI